MTIWPILEEASRRFADRPAVSDGARRLSYAELADRARAVSAWLAAAGAGAGDRVGILDDNSWTYLAAYFGAAHAGAVLLPLNHRLSGRELGAILADAEARRLIVAPAYRPLLAEATASGAPVDTILATDEVLRLDAGGREPAPVGPADLAHLYYTSGSTGQPKGVMLSHGNVCAHARAAVAVLGLGPGDAWGHFAPLFHLADAWATFALTLVGGRHVVLGRFDPALALDLVDREGVTLTNLVPTMLNRMVREPSAAGRDYRRLRLLLTGGAPVAPELVRRAMALFGCDYAQTYGLTETSPYLTLSLLDDAERRLGAEEQLARRARTGRPFPGVELEVVGGDDRPVAADDREVGEIRVRGASVSPGYWRRPEETAMAFRHGWLYTGDLATVDRCGSVRIVDRRKEVIITGGENVYSTEVEHALYEHPGVLECAVFGLDDPLWGEAVQAAVVPEPGTALTERELVDHCRALIAHYKAPRRVWLVDALPRLGSGKISKEALRRRYRAEAGAAGS